MERKTVNLSTDDLELLASFLHRGSDDQRRLAAEVGEESAPYLSESAALRALAVIGSKAVRSALMADGYRDLASEYADEDERFDAGAVDAAERSWRAEA
ncbi:MAG TPA: hypothetical protein VGB52_07735 [Actinomycetota bacterium]